MAKKYTKLTGAEKPTAESAKRARAFMGWYGLRFDMLRKAITNFNDEVATDTALKIYENLALKGHIITGKYKWYFLRAYHTNLIAWKKKEGAHLARVAELDEALYMEAPAEPDDEYEANVLTLRAEMLDFVRRHYPPYDASLFEIYVELHPHISYARMAKMLGIPFDKIWPVIGAIKKDLQYWFADRRAFLLTLD